MVLFYSQISFAKRTKLVASKLYMVKNIFDVYSVNSLTDCAELNGDPLVKCTEDHLAGLRDQEGGGAKVSS